MDSKDVMINDLIMKALTRAFKGEFPNIKVGIMGQKVTRADETGDLTNAEIGAKHEFGSPSEGLPVRSFLRMPLNVQLMKVIDSSNILSDDSLKQIVATRGLTGFAKKIGACAIRAIDDAFASGGFGDWKPSNMTDKKVHMTLVETSQLRRSIDYKVGE